MRERNRGLERVADYVREIAVAAEAMAELRGSPVALRMDEDEDAERLCFGPERVERRVRKFHAGDVAADADTAEPKLSNRMLNLIGSEIRKLQRRCREGDEPVRIAGAGLRQPLVLDLDHLGREITVLDSIPVGIDAQSLDVDRLLVHDLHAQRHG